MSRTQRCLQAAMLTVLAVAFLTSFESGRRGGQLLGYPGPIYAAALPLVCDVVAGIATLIHHRVRTDPAMRRLAARYVLVPMLASWAANAVDHLGRAQSATVWPPAATVAWVVGVVVAAGICPVAVAGLLHLSTRYTEHEQRNIVSGAPSGILGSPGGSTPPKTRPARAVPPTAPGGPHASGRAKPRKPRRATSPARPPATVGDLAARRATAGDIPASPAGDRVGELLAAGAGRRAISQELGISEHAARELLARGRNGVGE